MAKKKSKKKKKAKKGEYCKIRHFEMETLAKTLAGSMFAQILIFASPTLGTPTIIGGIILLVILTLSGMVAHYGLLTKCDLKNAWNETMIALIFSYAVTVFFATIWAGYTIQDIFSIEFFKTEALVSWAVGTFSAASLGAIEIGGVDVDI